MTRTSCFALVALVTCAGGTTAFAQLTGPSSSKAPYVLPVAPGIITKSILTVGDSVNNDPARPGTPYRMVGIPDGLGAFNNDAGNSFSLFMNHEIANSGTNQGAVRAHGFNGSFVSRWSIDRNTLQVIEGRDHNTAIADVKTWDSASSSYVTGTGASKFSRFCSADLAAPSAYQWTDTSSGTTYGTSARLFMNGEETGTEGRAFAHIVSGPNTNQSWQLPAMGRWSWENSVANPLSQRKTIVAGADDSSGAGPAQQGQVYFYVGDKKSTGNEIERAGLTDGKLFALKASFGGVETRTPTPPTSSTFSLVDVSSAAFGTGANLDAVTRNAGGTDFLRPEDFTWDSRPGFENRAYFVTTDRPNGSDANPAQIGRSRLYSMDFADIANPEAGGTLNILIDGAQGGEMFDNLTIDSLGRILIQEDIGNESKISRIWIYDTNSGQSGVVAQHSTQLFDPNYLGPGQASAAFITRDEESSGIIDAKDILGAGWFLLDVQSHRSLGGELVEDGQLVALYVDPSIVPTPGTLALLAGSLLLAGRRRR